jgi:hypothetical protein
MAKAKIKKCNPLKNYSLLFLPFMKRVVHSFFIFALCVKSVTAAPIHAVIIPITAAITVGLSNTPPDDVCVGSTVIGGKVVINGEGVIGWEIWGAVPLKGGRVPNTWVTWPGIT